MIAQEEEEDLNWEVDDDEEEEQQRDNTEELAEHRQEPIKEKVRQDMAEKENVERIVEESGVETVEEAPGLVKEEKNAAEPQPIVLGSSLLVVAHQHFPVPPPCPLPPKSYREQLAAEEEDLEWDEIEDLGEHEEKKGGIQTSSPALKEELRKRLSVAEDDEDLSWDIEDDDDNA